MQIGHPLVLGSPTQYCKHSLFSSLDDHQRYLVFTHARHSILLGLQGRRLFVIATTSSRPILTELGLSDTFDSELRIPPISNLRALEFVLKEVELFSSSDDRRRAVRMLEDAGFALRAEDETSSKLHIGVKKLLSIIEMARQEPENVAERLMGGLMGIGM